mgnify:CR=1 FL=1
MTTVFQRRHLMLGAAALAGTSLPNDRFLSAQLLGFQAPAANSLDVSSDRDFLLDAGAEAANMFIPGVNLAKIVIVKSLKLAAKS